MGGLEETFACTRLEYDALLAWGRYYHGEVLGKHSDITGTFDETTLRVLVEGDEENADFIARAIDLELVGHCGYCESIQDDVRCTPDYAERFTTKLGADRTAKLAALWGFATGGDEEIDDVRDE